MTRFPVIAITAGEPAGIGPDLCALLARETPPAHLVMLADRDLLAQRGGSLGVAFSAPAFDAAQAESAPPRVWIQPHDLCAPATAGKLDARNSPYVLRTLRAAIDGARSGLFDAIVTAPVHKAVINDAGISFSGHTEFLAQETQTEQVVMMLVGGGLRVALATTHLALKDVPAAITAPRLTRVLEVLERDLRERFKLSAPRILVAGLNPHAGESGHLGREEIDILIPVLNRFRERGVRLAGPLPADSLFTPKLLEQADCVLAMYHDQGLPVLKMKSFGQGVNVTLGLPFVRTSVDHGTALDLAGTGNVDVGSLRAALRLAIELAPERVLPQRAH